MARNMKQTCASCMFFVTLELDEGECRRFPAVLAWFDKESGDGAWLTPKVFQSDWCGEYKNKRSKS